ncbi:MAG: hypothetical protein ACQERX_02160 [Bacillota bacterium]
MNKTIKFIRESIKEDRERILEIERLRKLSDKYIQYVIYLFLFFGFIMLLINIILLIIF